MAFLERTQKQGSAKAVSVESKREMDALFLSSLHSTIAVLPSLVLIIQTVSRARGVMADVK